VAPGRGAVEVPVDGAFVTTGPAVATGGGSGAGSAAAAATAATRGGAARWKNVARRAGWAICSDAGSEARAARVGYVSRRTRAFSFDCAAKGFRATSKRPVSTRSERP